MAKAFERGGYRNFAVRRVLSFPERASERGPMLPDMSEESPVRDLALIVHVAAGVLAVLLGTPAIVVTLRRRRLNWVGESYHWVIVVLCLTAW